MDFFFVLFGQWTNHRHLDGTLGRRRKPSVVPTLTWITAQEGTLKMQIETFPFFFFTLLWNFVILLCDSPLFHFSIVCLMVGARQQQVPALAPVVTVDDRVWKMDVAIWLWNEVSLCSLRLRKWRNVILKLQGRSPAENTLLQMGHRAEPTSESRSKTATFCQLSGPHDGRAPSTVRTRKGLHKYMK